MVVFIKQEVIRRLDSLGRVVIPIHIRKKINLSEEDSLEIEIHDNEIIMRKHDFLLSNSSLLSNVCEAIYKSIGGTVLITNDNTIIASYGERLNVYSKGKKLSSTSLSRINECESIRDNVFIVSDFKEERYSYFVPIFGEAKTVKGMLVYLYNDILKENNRNIISSYAIFLSVMMRNKT